MENTDYYARPEMSNSKLTSYINGGGFGGGISQKAADLGHLFHAGIFEPHLYDETLDRIRDRVTDKEVKNITAMISAAKKCHSLQVFLSNPKAGFETEHYGDLFGIAFKMKADAEVPNAFGDGKSTAARTLDEFLKSFDKYGYWRQAYIYMKLGKKNKMMFWGVCKTAPHNTFYVDAAKYPEKIREAELQVEEYCKKWLKEQECDPEALMMAEEFAAFIEANG